MLVLANLAARPASEDLILSGNAVIKKLDGFAACHPTHLRAHADAATLVSAGDGPTVDEIMNTVPLPDSPWVLLATVNRRLFNRS
jgi:hypothetical protein